MAGTSFSLGTLEHDQQLLAPMGGAGLWTENLGHLTRKPKGQLRFVDSTFIKVHQVSKVPSEDLRIKPLDAPKAGTTQSSPRPLMNVDKSWHSYSSSAVR
jgi:hypothetical protein